MKETEKVLKQLNKFILNHVEDYDSVDEAVEAFTKLSNEASAKGETFVIGEMTNEEKATEELEKLEFAASEREYAAILERALKLDPDNLEARLFKLDPESLEFIHELKKLETLGKAVMQKRGLDDEESIGNYWGIVETRTYLRIKALYADELQKRRMLTASVREYEDILRLNEADNMGIRYILMGIYCQLEQMEKAKELYQRSPEASAQMLLPLILLSLKYDDELSAKRYYKDLQKENKSCKKVFGRREFDLESMVEAIDAVDYLADSEEELYIAISNVMTDFAVVPDMYYFNWLKKNLIKPPSSKPSKPSKKWIQKKK
ncbi:MAG TPA: hypothetical protein DCY16_00085 [Trichococcus sp.]|jgi:tetratricopeptide (TPR) repeat protein|uniref:hypothetical protein n=1 Tax=uncultured Trichococcus sp. TaxID=189665 RepID=UPI000E8EDB61|nr:hypothetical protein [uncultured Trichococcus sp.]MBP6165254.1 hypothetical protein [Trichococcus sp.]HRA69256.1 hypothetical protein [Trichococcus flocculiformis]MBP6247056.1 hypothetical protein [Trichococcus sp.]MBP7128791.1 hypothetical protein [Trichococcus sp.]MBP8683003.1 hypothetical protein [Trichococcus sp.]